MQRYMGQGGYATKMAEMTAAKWRDVGPWGAAAIAADQARNSIPNSARSTNRAKRKTSWNPYKRSLSDYNKKSRRNFTGGPMGEGWFADRYRKR